MNKWIQRFQNKITSKLVEDITWLLGTELWLPNGVNLVTNYPQNQQQRVFECPKIPKNSDLGLSTQNPFLTEKKRSKDPTVWKMPQGWSALDKLQVQWRTQERNSHFWNFQIQIRISNLSCCLHVFSDLKRLLLASRS